MNVVVRKVEDKEAITEVGLFKQIPLQLKKEGLGFVKLKRGSKVPFENAWQDNPYSFEQISEWYEAGNNYGVISGYGNLIIIDVDKPDGILDTLQESLPNTFVIKTSKGYHLYYFCEGVEKKIVITKDKVHYGEVIANKSQVVGPGSVHPDTKKTYEIINDVEIATITKEKMLSTLSKYLDLDSEKKSKGTCRKNKKDILVPYKIREQGNKNILVGERNSTLTSLAGSMHHRGMSEESIRKALLTENETRCEEPLSEREVNTIVDSIIGYENSNSSKTTVKNKRIQLTKIDLLLLEPEKDTEYVVEDLLPCSGLSLLCGKPKTGKTTLVRQLVMCVAQGFDFLDRSVSKGSVLYFALEEKRSEIGKHFKSMGLLGDEDIYIHVSGAMYDAFKEMKEIADEYKPSLIIIDPLFRFVNVKDGNDYHSMTRALDPLIQLARDTNSHIMCVHHLNKGDRQGTDGILGSTAIFGTVDTALILKKDQSGKRIIQSVQRYGQDLEESVLTFNPVTRMSTIQGSRYEVEVKRISGLIYEFLSKQTAPLTEKEISKEIGGKNSLKINALRKLFFGEQKIIREGLGLKGDPYKYSCSPIPTINKEREKEVAIKESESND